MPIRRSALCGLIAFDAACESDAPRTIDAAIDAESAPLLPCGAPGDLLLFEFDDPDVPHPIASGEELPVVLGFQGFVFVEVGLRTRVALGDFAVLQSQVQLEDGRVLTAAHPGTAIVEESTGARRTGKVLVFFNDVPLVELYGQTVEIDLSATAVTEDCRVSARRRVRLVRGPTQLADAGAAPP